MTIEQFWEIVERVHAASPQDMEAKCKSLGMELRQLDVGEIHSFENHFTELWYRAYDWQIWDAAYIINGGCSDDSFMDFRAVLISLGCIAYGRALQDADSLAEVDFGGGWACYEGYQYVATKAYEEITGKIPYRWAVHPKEPTGVEIQEWDFGKRYPKLAAKYGHNDDDLAGEKKRHEDNLALSDTAKKLALHLLDSGLIAPSGWIPPQRILAHVLRAGRPPASTGRESAWAPVVMDEPLFWRLVNHLEKMSANELAEWPELRATKLRLDVGSPPVETFEERMQSLDARGLL